MNLVEDNNKFTKEMLDDVYDVYDNKMIESFLNGWLDYLNNKQNSEIKNK